MNGVGRLTWMHVFCFLIIVMLGISLAKNTRSKFLTAMVCLGMICVAGLRHGYVDTRAYRLGFEVLNPSKVLTWDFILDADSKDKGFSVLSAIIKLFTDNSQTFLFILSFVTVACLFYGIIKRVPGMNLGVYLFIATGCYLDTMNGARQALVAAVLFFLLPELIEKKKFKVYLIVVLLCSTVHASALFFIPLYFVAAQKPWSGYTWGIVAVCLVLYVFFNSGVGTAIADMLEGTSYGDVYGEMLIEADTSVNFYRVIVAAVPVAMSFFSRKQREEDLLSYNIVFNMSFVNMFIWLFATKMKFFYRMAMYFSPYMIVLLCYEMYMIKDIETHRTVKFAAIFCYFIFFVYSLYVVGDQFFVGYLKY